MADAHSGPVLLGGIGGKIGVSMPPAGYFLCAQKVTRRRHGHADFTTNSPQKNRTAVGIGHYKSFG